MNNRYITIILATSLAISSCGNPTKDKTQNEERYSQRYIATDGTNVMVFFGKEKGKRYIEIQNNGKTIRVRQQNERDSLRYEENGILIHHNRDSLFIEQDNLVIKLRRPKGN